MARFPQSTEIRARVYHIDIPEGAPVFDAPLTGLHRYFAAQIGEGCMDGILFRSRVPPALTFTKEELWGWCYLDDENPVSVGPWLAWGIRGWKKRVPSRLFGAVVEERCKAWCKEQGRERCPSSVKKEIKENARTELLANTPPEVGDAAVLVDLQRRRLVLPHLTEAQAKGVSKRVKAILREIIHPDVVLVEWDLEEYLMETRPNAALPSEVGDRWLAFLTEQANREAWAVFRDVPEHKEPVVFQLTLDGQVKLATDESDTIRAEGDEAVKDALRWVGDEARVRVREVNLMITEPEPSTRQFALRLDNTGAIKSCKIIGGEKWEADDLDAAVFERAETMTEIATYVRLLMHAFDAGPLQTILLTGRQAQLWPGSVEPKVEWYDELPSPGVLGLSAPELGGPDERARRRQAAYQAGLEALSDDERAIEAHQRRGEKSEAFRIAFASAFEKADPNLRMMLDPDGTGRTSVSFSVDGKEAVVFLGSDMKEDLLALWRDGKQVEAIAKYRAFARCDLGKAKAKVEELAVEAGLQLYTAPPAPAPDEEAQPGYRGGSVTVTAEQAARGVATIDACAARHPGTGLRCDAGTRAHKRHGCANPDEPGKRLQWSGS